ncbi:MAG TPA: sigma-70 family RNA polymerase sigma factor [Planctomycetota bacterium]|jgi:RNA polymerase primary sigma factor|nr:sigma-70 family RNA polymerase sigma factor [Planctomycetota bacterium]
MEETVLDLRGRLRVGVSELDPFLDVGIGAFPRIADEIVRRLDEAGVEVVVDPPARRGEPSRGGVLPASAFAFAQEVARIVPMDREEEGRLARRFDLLERRYRAALRAARLPPSSEDGGPGPCRGIPACDHEGRGGFPACLFDAAPPERRASLHARRVERDAARNALVERSLWLVLRLVRPYLGFGIPVADLAQEGTLGLLAAAERFDWTRGVRFATYAGYSVIQALQAASLRCRRLIRIPFSVQKARRKVSAALLGADPGREVPLQELAARARVSARSLRGVREAERLILSLDSGIAEEGGGSEDVRRNHLEDARGGIDLDSIEDLRPRDRLRRAMGTLGPREQLVLERRFGLNGSASQTLEEVAVDLGVSPERVRQIQVRALRRLGTGDTGRLLSPLVA